MKMTPPTTVEELFNHAAEFAVMAFQAAGEVLPMWIAQDEKGQITPISTPFTSPEEKDVTATAVRALLLKLKAVRCAFICESWMLIGKPDEKLPAGYKMGDSIAKRPDRIECITITAEDNRGQSRMGYYRIIRPPQGKAKLSALEGVGVAMGTGRFTGLLLPEPISHEQH